MCTIFAKKLKVYGFKDTKNNINNKSYDTERI